MRPARWSSIEASGGELLARLLRRAKSAACREHGSEVIGQPFVDPDEFAAHGLLKVGSGHACGAPILSIPGVRKFVREEVGGEQAAVRIDKRMLCDAIVAAFVMLLAQGTERCR